MSFYTSPTTTPSPLEEYCNEDVFETDMLSKYTHWFLIPAVGIIVLLGFLEKRKSVKPELCWGRPSLVRPFSFMDEPSNRWGITFAFGAVTAHFLQVAFKTFSAEFPIWAKIFLVYILSMETSLVCYPLFACMTTRHKLAGAITGLLYSTGWLAFQIFRLSVKGICYVKYHESGSPVIIAELPASVFSLVVFLKFCWKLYKCIWLRKFVSTDKAVNKFCREFHLTYVKALMTGQRTSKHTQREPTFQNLVLEKFVQPVKGFRYPIAILITAMTSCTFIFLTTTKLIVIMQNLVMFYFPEDRDLGTAIDVIATMITVMCGLRNIYLVLFNYRRDMLLLYKGDKSFIPETLRNKSPNTYMAQGVRFIGNSIVGSLWGSVFCYLTLFIPLFLMCLVIRYLGKKGKVHLLWLELQWIIYPVCMVIIFQVQIFMVGRYFMQPKLDVCDKHKPLALRNRLAYDVFSFFMVFLNASIGMVQYIKRILIGAILGVFLIARMDRPLLIRGYETMDKCYTNYIGMILVDVAHNHPVLRVFCHVIMDIWETERSRTLVHEGHMYSNVEHVYSNMENNVETQNHDGHSKDTGTKRKNTMAYRRWLVAVTLIRNPDLVQYRVHGKPRDIRTSSVSVGDVGVEDRTVLVENDGGEMVMDTWGCQCSCCDAHKYTVSPNIITNILAGIVVIACFFTYAGLKPFLEDFTAP